MSHAQNTNTRTLCQDIQQDLFVLFVWWDAQQALSSCFTKKINYIQPVGRVQDHVIDQLKHLCYRLKIGIV
jgi:hypothetical protein